MIIRMPYTETALGTLSFQLSPEQEKECVARVNAECETAYANIQEAISAHDFYFCQHLYHVYCEQYDGCCDYVNYEIDEYQDFELDESAAHYGFEDYFRVEED